MVKGTAKMVQSITQFSSDEISSRLSLYSSHPSPLDPIKLRERFIHDENITIMESLDESQLSIQAKSQLAKFYPNASLAYIKVNFRFFFFRFF